VNRFKNSVSLPQLLVSRFILFSLFCFVVSSAFQNPVPTHNIIFDEVGKMAASMTYIHVAIPLNISTFEDQISLFQYYLDHHFLTMTTNDSNAILFTKTIRDLAHFASLRLQYLADKVKYIDHLLPDDSDPLRQKRQDDPNSLERQKRMMTLVPWIICMDELKTTKASTLEDERILRREIFKYIKENEWLRSEIHACRNPPYPDLPEFHATFKNSTYPQAPPLPTKPLPPFSAFRPKPTSYLDPNSDTLLDKPPRSVSPRSRHYRTYDPDSPWLIDELRQDRLVNTLPVFKHNYTEDDRLLFANMTDNDKYYFGDDLALDFVDPEYDPSINITLTDPEFSNTTNPNFSNATDNFTSIPDPDLSHIFGENLYPHNLATQMKFFRNLVSDSGSLANSTTETPLSRAKRQLLVAAAAFSGVLGTFFGLYNSFEISKIQKDILNLSDQHNLLVGIVKKHEHQIHELADDLDHLTEIIRLLITYNPALVYAKFEHNVRIIEDRLSVLFDTLQQLQHQRLSVTLLDEHQMNLLHQSVINTATSRNLQVLPTRPQDYFQLDLSYIRSGKDVLMILHVPCVTKNHLLSIYKYIPFPYPTFHTTFSDSFDRNYIHSVSDVLARTNDSASSLFLIPETEMIAIGRTSMQGQAQFKLISNSDLAGCVKRNHIYLCEKHQVLQTNLAGTCLGALYLQHEGGVIENCQIKRKPIRETVYQLNANEHLIFSPKPFTAQIICQNGSHFPVQLLNTQKILVPDFCSVNLINHTILSDGNIRLSPPALQMQMTLNLNLFPSEMMETLTHADDEFNRIHRHLERLMNDTITDDVFNGMLHKNMLSSSSTLSTVLWTLFGLSVSAILLLGCWYCNTLRRSHARLRKIRRHNKEAEAGTPLRPLRTQVLLATAPPGLEEEDEISYLARTSAVPRSFWPISFRRP
jgi:hypothetical protein